MKMTSDDHEGVSFFLAMLVITIALWWVVLLIT